MKNLVLRMVACVLMIAGLNRAGPLLWRDPNTLAQGKSIFMVGLSYNKTDKSWNADSGKFLALTEAQQVTTMGAHFMLGFAPIKKLEIMAHLPVVKKDRDTLSSIGLADVWFKTRYNFLSGKNHPAVTGVLALRIPTAPKDARPALDDRTMDIAIGALAAQNFGKMKLHLKLGYWYNMKDSLENDIGDDIEAIIKLDCYFMPKAFAFLNLEHVETFKSKNSTGAEIPNSDKRRFTVTPGATLKDVLLKGLNLRPKVGIPVKAVCRGGSLCSWSAGIDIWFMP
jgi:hypothetical protein